MLFELAIVLHMEVGLSLFIKQWHFIYTKGKAVCGLQFQLSCRYYTEMLVLT